MMYVHKPIAADEIRVVYLETTASGEIRCRMRHIAFTDAEYTALSYPWGPKKFIEIPIIDDKEDDGTGEKRIPVTEQLHLALQDIVKSSIEPKAFWIDQICINQTNVGDKEYHVKRMRYIYPKAKMVVTYTGPSADGDDAAIDLFEKLAAKYVVPWEDGEAFKHDSLWQWLMSLETRRSDLASQATTDASTATAFEGNTYGLSRELRDCMQSPLPEHKGWPALIAIFLGPWGQRRWMTQENVLNNNTKLLRGSRILNQRHAVHLLSLLRFQLHFGVLPVPQSELASVPREEAYLDKVKLRQLASASNLSRASRTGAKESGTRYLHELLNWFRSAQCADPRDRIYALLSLAQDDDDLNIAVDYTSLEEVGAGEVPQKLLNRVSVAILRRHGFALYNRSREAENAARPSGMPSWVPLWEPGSSATGLIHPGRQRIDTTKDFPIDSCIRIEENDTVLAVKGYHIGPVSKIFGTCRRRFFDNLQISKKDNSLPQYTLGRSFRAAEEHLRSHGVQDMDYVLGSTYLARLLWIGHSSHVPQSRNRCETCAEQIRVAYKAAVGILDSEGNVAVEDDRDLGVELIKDLGVYSAQLSVINGKLPCWVPLDAQENDIVFRLVGAVTGFVLRLVDDGRQETYRMIGPAYVHGYMYGEEFELGHDWVDGAQEIRIV